MALALLEQTTAQVRFRKDQQISERGKVPSAQVVETIHHDQRFEKPLLGQWQNQHQLGLQKIKFQ